jgi:hypothetical protein
MAAVPTTYIFDQYSANTISPDKKIGPKADYRGKPLS